MQTPAISFTPNFLKLPLYVSLTKKNIKVF